MYGLLVVGLAKLGKEQENSRDDWASLLNRVGAHIWEACALLTPGSQLALPVDGVWSNCHVTQTCAKPALRSKTSLPCARHLPECRLL